MIEPKWVMVLDSNDGQLGGVGLQLVRLGVDAVYVKHLDEASLQILEHAGRIGAILLPSTFSPDELDDVLEQVAKRAGLGPESLAILGARIDAARCELLAKKGVRWRLWSPFDEAGLRFIARAPLWVDDDADLRIDLRVPVNLACAATCAGETRRTLVSDLSTGGAYLETRSPFATGEGVAVSLGLPDGEVELSADVRWSHDGRGGAAPAARPPGMGVEFGMQDQETLSRLRKHLNKVLERYRL